MNDTREDPFDTGILPQAADSPVLVVLNPDHGGDRDLNQAASLVRQITGRDPAAYTDEAGITVVYASPAPDCPQPPEFTPDQRARAETHQRNLECSRGHKSSWVVLQRPVDHRCAASLQCTACGRTWRTRAAYADSLPDARNTEQETAS